MSIISRKIYKSSNYELNLTGIVPVRGYYETTITGTCFVKGERPAVSTTKITDSPCLVMRWPKTKGDPAKNQLTLQGIKEVKNPKNYQLNLTGIVPVRGYYQTTITDTCFVKGERPAVSTTKITAPPVLKLAGTKSTPTKKAPVLTIVAPAVLAVEQNAETNESSSSDDGGDSEEPEPDLLCFSLFHAISAPIHLLTQETRASRPLKTV